MWLDRLVMFTDDNAQVGDLVAELARKYPQAKVHHITTDGRLIAFDNSAT